MLIYLMMRIKYHINPTGKFVVEDLRHWFNRKKNYRRYFHGGKGAHGGGAFGKDPSA